MKATERHFVCQECCALTGIYSSVVVESCAICKSVMVPKSYHDWSEKRGELIINSMDHNVQITLKEYLKDLLATVWVEGEGFSGKRPWGNSGWQYDVYTALIKANLVEGEIDEDGCVDEVDTKVADKIIIDIIGSL